MFFNENNTDKKTPTKNTSISDFDQFVDIENNYKFSEDVYQDRDVRKSYKALGSMSSHNKNNKVDFSHAVIKPYGITGVESYSSGSGFTISSALGASKSSSLNEEYEVDYIKEPLNLNRLFDNKSKLNSIANTSATNNSTIIDHSIDIASNMSISTFENSVTNDNGQNDAQKFLDISDAKKAFKNYSNSVDLNNQKKTEKNFIKSLSSNKILPKEQYMPFDDSKESLDQKQSWARRIEREQSKEQVPFLG